MQSVPEVASLSEQQSYQLYVQASNPTQPDEDANLRNSNGADQEDHVLSEDSHSNLSCDYQLGRRRVRQLFYILRFTVGNVSPPRTHGTYVIVHLISYIYFGVIIFSRNQSN